MTLDTILSRDPLWQRAEDAPHADIAVLSLCNLGRNLSDVPFPALCNPDERCSVEDRLLRVLDQFNLLSSGEYFSLVDLRPSEVQLLAERQLITLNLTTPRKGQGVYIAHDQSLSILVNDEDHCCIRVISSGLNLQDAWARASRMDDLLSGVLDFAFSPTMGFLTRNLNHLGTGLKFSLLLHLPACVQEGALHEIHTLTEPQNLDFSGIGTGVPDLHPADKQELSDRWPVYSQALYNGMGGFMPRGLHETEGDLFQLRNRTTLGHTEEELIFRLKQCAAEIVKKEEGFREKLREKSLEVLQDRIERAQALAASARLIPFDESFSLLSSLRLGVALGLLSGQTVADLNGSLIHCQGAHVERQLQSGSGALDDLSLKRMRARQFKTQFSPTQG
jgi:protein arginine kinase